MGKIQLNLPAWKTAKAKADVKDKPQSLFSHPLLDLPFRSFFLLAPLFAALSLSLWLMFLNGWYSPKGAGLSATLWHIHEMIFGFAATIGVAFLLTAVQTWTGQRSLHGKLLAFVLGLWLIIRLALLINTPLLVDMAIAAQLLWWLIMVAVYSRIVISAKNQRNYLFIPILVMMGALNISVLLAERLDNTALALHLSRSMVLVMGLLMGIVGGRVIPFFSQKGTGSELPITSPVWLTQWLTLLSVAGIIVFTLDFFIALAIEPAVLMISAGVLHLAKLCFWRSWRTIRVPLLWSLHLSYLILALGLIALGLSYYLPAIIFSDGLHLITVGGMSLMILSMISRVSLGHTGRALTVKPIISLAFILMFSAALIRAGGAVFLMLFAKLAPSLAMNPYVIAWNLGAVLWIIAMLIFAKVYWPILIAKRER